MLSEGCIETDSARQRRKWSALTTLVVLAAMTFCGAASLRAASSNYSYTVLARPGDTFDGQTIQGVASAVINKTGAVAFAAYLTCTPAPPATFCYNPTAIFKTDDKGVTHLLAGSGSAIGGQTLKQVTNAMAIDNKGTVYFSCSLADGTPAICSDSQVIVKAGDTVGGVTLQSIGAFAVGENGDLVFLGTWGQQILSSGFQDLTIYRGLFTPGSLLVKSCDYYEETNQCYPGGPMGDLIGGQELVTFAPTLAVNDAGSLVFGCQLAGSPNFSVCSTSSILAQNGAMISGLTLTSFGEVAIRKNGDTAFVAQFTPLSSGISTGIFTPSSVLVKTGDVIGGNTIVGATYFATDNKGALVFETSYIQSSPVKSVNAIATVNEILLQDGDVIGGITLRFGGSGLSINSTGDIAISAEDQNDGNLGVLILANHK